MWHDPPISDMTHLSVTCDMTHLSVTWPPCQWPWPPCQWHDPPVSDMTHLSVTWPTCQWAVWWRGARCSPGTRSGRWSQRLWWRWWSCPCPPRSRSATACSTQSPSVTWWTCGTATIHWLVKHRTWVQLKCDCFILSKPCWQLDRLDKVGQAI